MISGVYDSMHLMHKEIKSAEAENGKEFSTLLNDSISQNEIYITHRASDNLIIRLEFITFQP
mgnify:CR=1 FL=1